jgi:hypothetical protein
MAPDREELVASDDASKTRLNKERPPDTPLQGAILVLIQFDVCEEIRLDSLRQLLGLVLLSIRASSILLPAIFAISVRRSLSRLSL